MAKNRVVLTWGEAMSLAPKEPGCVTMRQQGIDRFSVTYGLQVKDRLTYGQAAMEFGACCMHAAACYGLLDNRGPGER